MAKITQFSGKYSKSYKTVDSAEKAIEKFEKKYATIIKETYSNSGRILRWILTVDSNDSTRIIPAVINPIGSTIMHVIIEAGHACTGTIG